MKKVSRIIALFLCSCIFSCATSCNDKDEKVPPIDPRVKEVTTNFFDRYWDQEANYFYLYNSKRVTGEHIDARPGLGKYTDFWVEAQLFETVMDVYERQPENMYFQLIHDVYDGFSTFFKKYKNNKFNDDIGWWAMACSRAYSLTEDDTYMGISKELFDYIYERGFSQDLGGGVFWNTDNKFKNTCTNAPAVVTAARLSEYYKDADYLSIATNLFNWLVENVYDLETGKVSDGKSFESVLNDGQHIYNYGTFSLAAYELYRLTKESKYLTYAEKAIDYALSSNKLENDILIADSTNDGSAFRGIFLRTLNIFAKNGSERYQDIINKNALSAYSNRREIDGLSGYDWTAIPIDELEIYSSNVATTVSLMQYFVP